MTLRGVDYSYSGPMTAAQARANGLSFVIRYVSSPGQAKNLRPSEVADFTAGGIAIVIVYEDGKSRALGGWAQGVADAQIADAQVNALGLGGCPIIFAIDFDAQPHQYATVIAYIDGAASVIGLARTGAYAGYYVIKPIIDGRHARYTMQTLAWSDGKIDARCHIYQDRGAVIAGVTVDLDRTIVSDTDYGQARRVGPNTSGQWLDRLLHWSA